MKHVQEQGDVIPTDEMRALIEGEAYAIRAYCQFDILRLFGQMPQGGTKSVSLPYSNTTQLDEMPAYYNFSEYVAKLKADLKKAETLLKDNDPICQYAFEDINKVTVNDDFMTNRRFRLNYWAVKALQARLALYLGETAEAHSLALEIINEKDNEGDTKFTLSGSTDLNPENGCFALPSEALFMLSKYDVKETTESLLIGGFVEEIRTYMEGNYYLVGIEHFTELFKGVITGSDNRYLYQWNKLLKNPSGLGMNAIKKYWYEESASDLLSKHRVIPMLRMSEIYLIAIETATDLQEANQLYHTYMRSHDVLLTSDAFVDMTAIKSEIINEYRRELFAEGQMFFTYKRTNSPSILWKIEGVADENVYVIPLPNTEYNPN